MVPGNMSLSAAALALDGSLLASTLLSHFREVDFVSIGLYRHLNEYDAGFQGYFFFNHRRGYRA